MKASFKTNPALRQLKRGEELWQLEDILVFFSALLHKLIVVPKGFITDFASVPRLPLAYLLFGNKGHFSAIVHDWLYSTQMFERRVCDQVFKEALEAEGLNKFEIWMMFAGVRIGGWVGWGAENRPQPRAVQETLDKTAM